MIDEGNGGKKECDIVMRGGITSGVVYPGVVVGLARAYNFRSIGGTSAGAIAAAVTAAASLGRDTGAYQKANGGADPFDHLVAKVPGSLGDRVNGVTRLESLFQPDAGTRPVWRVVSRSFRKTFSWWRLPNIVITAIAAFPLPAIGLGLLAYAIGALLTGSFTLGVAASEAPTWLNWVGAGLTVLAVLVSVVTGAFAALIVTALLQIPKHRFGLCSGHDQSARHPPLTDWLHNTIQKAAGGPTKPVTFGDLWQNDGDANATRRIELVLVTTNVTRGTSHMAPFPEGAWGPLFFRKTEFDDLFPAEVVNHMVNHPSSDDDHQRLKDNIIIPDEDYFRMPSAADFPILVAARLSLSFPLLIQAVPLYATEYDATLKKFKLKRVWFSDGGLTSNFPIHLFDSVLPRRPTFGINLISQNVTVSPAVEDGDGQPYQATFKTGASVEGSSGWDRIYMPERNSDGISSVAKFNDLRGKSVFAFLMAAFDAARNWADTEAMAQPGYRDRIVHISLGKGEGGMTLGMDEGTIENLNTLGTKAAELLTARFGGEVTVDPKSHNSIRLDWDNHRWIRYRTAMAGLEGVAWRFSRAWDAPAPGQTFADLLGRKSSDPPTSYKMAQTEMLPFAKEKTMSFLEWAKDLGGDDHTFDRGESSGDGRSPRPKPALRLVPTGENDAHHDRPWRKSAPSADGNRGP